MSETPAETIRRAVALLRDPVFCGDRATPAIADWLDAAGDTAQRAEAEGASIHPDSYALKVARAYLGEVTP